MMGPKEMGEKSRQSKQNSGWIGLNILLAALILSVPILALQGNPNPVYAAVPHTSSAQDAGSPTPEPTRTPFFSNRWSLTGSLRLTPSPTPTPTPSPTPEIPLETRVYGISGRRQSLPLSCESRSAVDWAAFFGYSIDEVEFHYGLPVHDNPDKGFVGDVNGSWGQTPPKPYGVHSPPVAQRLREYGVQAMHVFDMTLEQLKAEIAAGRPVMIWVTGHVGYSPPLLYTDSEGDESVVAKFEHTVIVFGYTENKLLILDGAKTYTRYNKEFMKSWGVLENQAVVWIE
jgi:uncharacterized protein YvpB